MFAALLRPLLLAPLASMEALVLFSPSATGQETSRQAVDKGGATTAPPTSNPDQLTLDQRMRLLEQELQALKTEAAAKATPTPVASPPAGVTDASAEPFAFADFTWLNGNSRQTDFPLDSPVFTGEFTLDANYVSDFTHPKDHTLIGSTNVGRTDEVQVEQLGVGGDFHWKHIRGRFMTQFGLYATMTPRNDASPSIGQWNLADAYRYISEAYGGYHFDALHGINIDAGIFMSYIGLCSYYNYENWVYQMSYVSANTPWFFNGIRAQIYPSEKFKLELWLINGWQSYGMFNEEPGVGFQTLWRPNGNFSFVSNNYVGADTPGNTSQYRIHTDDSIEVKYFDQPAAPISKAAFSLTFDLGCQMGNGASCSGGSTADYFAGFMVYNRLWFDNNLFGFTLGGGGILNPGRYLVLLPPINGATAASGTPYFTENPGDKFMAWDASATVDYMPSQFITVRLEYIHRQSSVPYFAGADGITPSGGNQGPLGSQVPGFTPDLLKYENRINAALLIRL